MEFCPDCGSMLMPKDGVIKCSCGYEKSLTKDDLLCIIKYGLRGSNAPIGVTVDDIYECIGCEYIGCEYIVRFPFFISYAMVSKYPTPSAIIPAVPMKRKLTKIIKTKTTKPKKPFTDAATVIPAKIA